MSSPPTPPSTMSDSIPPDPSHFNPPISTWYNHLLAGMQTLLSTNFTLYDQHIELFKRGYLAGDVAADGIQHLLCTPAILEVHLEILRNEYVPEPVYEQSDYFRLVRAVEVVYVSMVEEEAFKTVLIMMERLANDVLVEREGRGMV